MAVGKGIVHHDVSELVWDNLRVIYRYTPDRHEVMLVHLFDKNKGDARLFRFNAEIGKALQQSPLDPENPIDALDVRQLQHWLYHEVQHGILDPAVFERVVQRDLPSRVFSPIQGAASLERLLRRHSQTGETWIDWNVRNLSYDIAGKPIPILHFAIYAIQQVLGDAAGHAGQAAV